MDHNTKAWSDFYNGETKRKPSIPENFIGRIFLSRSPVMMLANDDFRNKRILDIGCGDGRHCSFFNSLGFAVSGCEISADQIESLKTKYPEISFDLGRSDDLGYEDMCFDYVCAVNSIYYLRDQDTDMSRNLQEALRVLKPNGKLVASFLGNEHFILRGTKRKKNGNVIIENDHLDFRNGIAIRPVWSRDEIDTIFSTLRVRLDFVGETQDRLDEFNRHLYYVVCTKLE